MKSAGKVLRVQTFQDSNPVHDDWVFGEIREPKYVIVCKANLAMPTRYPRGFALFWQVDVRRESICSSAKNGLEESEFEDSLI